MKYFTYEADLDLDTEFTKGTEFAFPFAWGYTEDGITQSIDVSVIIKKDSTLLESLILLEDQICRELSKFGATEFRHYYIEHLIINENDKTVFIVWGS